MADRTSINISLPESLREWIDEQVEKGGYASASDFILHVLHEEQMRDAEDELEELLLEGMNSPAVTMTDADWEAMEARVRQHAAAHRKKTG